MCWRATAPRLRSDVESSFAAARVKCSQFFNQTFQKMSEVRVAAASRTFARGNILFGIIAFGIAGRDEVLLSSKTIRDFRALSKDHKVALVACSFIVYLRLFSLS